MIQRCAFLSAGVLSTTRLWTQDHLSALEGQQAEAEAKHRLYTLLYERTKCGTHGMSDRGR